MTVEGSRDEGETKNLDRRPFEKAKDLPIVDSLPVGSFRGLTEAILALEDPTLGNVDDLITSKAREIDEVLWSHLIDVGTITELLMDDAGFEERFIDRVAKSYPAERLEEARVLFSAKNKAILKAGMRIHDVGKIPENINTIINIKGKLNEEQRTESRRHTGVYDFLNETGLLERYPRVSQIALFHHWPSYGGGNPYDESVGFLDMNTPSEGHEMQTPFMISLAKWIDIFHGMVEFRPYRDRDMLWRESARSELPDNHPLKQRYTIERELRERSPEDMKRGGHLISVFLDTLYSLWEEIQEKMVSEHGRVIAAPSLPKDYLKMAG